MNKINKKNKTITNISEKSKTIAIVLAVIFGIFSYIYTWKFDHKKFWYSWVVYIVIWWLFLLFGIVDIAHYMYWALCIVAIIVMATRDEDMFENYNKWKIEKE